MTTTTYTVKGMSCQHCVDAVTGELSKLDGVTAVDVALENGTVTITSDAPLDDDAVLAAINEAGYELVA
ncbi:MAG: heavy-metal-associated domain-containing protein [Acidimicrobiales bacterium]